MTSYALYSIKGGVGKTAAAVNLAWLSAQDGARTVVWDLDPQGAASFYFRVRPRLSGTGKRLLRGSAEMRQRLRGSDYEDLDVLPADLSLRHIERSLDREGRPERLFAKRMRDLEAEFDNVFLDCPPSIGRLSECIFGSVDVLLVPTIPTTLSLRTLAQLMKHLKGRRSRPRVLPFFSMVDRRKGLHKSVLAWAREHELGFLRTTIPFASDVERMGVHREPLFEYAGRSPAARAFRELWREVVDARVEPQARPPLFAKRNRRLLERIGRPELPTGPPSGDHVPMPSDREIEFKFRLRDGEDFQRLRRAMDAAPSSPTVLQVNHFFDTAEADLRREGFALRLREEVGSYTLTAKGPKEQASEDGAWSVRGEVETKIGAELARRCLANEVSPLELLRRERSSPLLDAIQRAVGDGGLHYVGNFENERTRVGPVELRIGEHSRNVRYEFDRTRFPGNDVHYEVEVEVPSEGDAEELYGALVGVLEDAEVTWTTAPSKARRFFEALGS